RSVRDLAREVGTDPPGTDERESDGPAPCPTRPQPAPRRLPQSPPPLRGTSRAAGVLRERHRQADGPAVLGRHPPQADPRGSGGRADRTAIRPTVPAGECASGEGSRPREG